MKMQQFYLIGLFATVVCLSTHVAAEDVKTDEPCSFEYSAEANQTWRDTRSGRLFILLFKNGDKYEGYFKNNYFNGDGTFTCKNGDKYSGKWVDSKRSGDGTLYFHNGDKYEGNWHEGRRHGSGKMRFANGDVYVGGWQNDKRNGQGVYTYKDGSIYEGSFVNDCKEGKGTLVFIGGLQHAGDLFKNKISNVIGVKNDTMFKNYGYKYSGEWKQDQMHGWGHFFFRNGDEYKVV